MYTTVQLFVAFFLVSQLLLWSMVLFFVGRHLLNETIVASLVGTTAAVLLKMSGSTVPHLIFASSTTLAIMIILKFIDVAAHKFDSLKWLSEAQEQPLFDE